MLKELTINIFISLQNGTLVERFFDNSIELNKYEDTILKLKLNTNPLIEKLLRKENGRKYVDKLSKSYLNFRDFILDDTNVIDYTYLWDFVCKHLFPKQVNLVIFRENQIDITNQVEILCPTNHYSNTIYNFKHQTLFIYQNRNYFEPLLLFKSKVDEPKIKQFGFTISDNSIKGDLKNTLQQIKESIVKCEPYDDFNYKNTYVFKNNLNAKRIYDIFTNNNISILKQVLNFNSQIIGLVIKYKNIELFVPTNPSNIFDNDVEIVFVDDNGLWNEYSITRDLYNEISKKYTVPFTPRFKVKEDGLLIGIITETNQFVALSKPSEDIYENDLETINNFNDVEIDTNTILSHEEDKERVELVKRIKLESNFFSAFRNTIKIILSKKQNLQFRKDIENVLQSQDLYLNKLNKLIEILKNITKKYILFTRYKDETIKQLNKIVPCISKEDCNTSYCVYENKLCKLLLPQEHLFTKENNYEIYHGRIADELIRYVTLHSYILGYETHLSIQKINYNLRDNEIILLESSLENYFTDLIPFQDSKYVKFNTFENVEPIDSDPTQNILQIREKAKQDKGELTEGQLKEEEDEEKLENQIKISECISDDKKKLVTTEKERLIKKYGFPKTTNKILFNREINNCGIFVFQIILKDLKKEEYSITSIKETLKTFYKTSMKRDELEKQLKAENKIWEDYEDVYEYILSSEYFISKLDITTLCYIFKIPLILLLSKKKIKDEKANVIVYNSPINALAESYYVIRLGANKKTKGKTISIELYESKPGINILFETISFTDDFKEIMNLQNYKFSKFEKMFK